jgi:hypothetical protein
VAHLVAGRFDRAACIETDWFWTTIVRGHVQPWLAEAHEQNGTVLRAYATAAAELALGGYTVVVDGIIGPWYLDLVTDGLRRTGGDVSYIVLRPDIDVALARATTRAPRTADAAPLADAGTIRALWEQFQDLGSLERHVVDNGGQDPQETASLVWTRFVNGDDRL